MGNRTRDLPACSKSASTNYATACPVSHLCLTQYQRFESRLITGIKNWLPRNNTKQNKQSDNEAILQIAEILDAITEFWTI
jgi:hypothetical protein